MEQQAELKVEDNQVVRVTYTQQSTPISSEELRRQIARQKEVIAELEVTLAQVEALEADIPAKESE